MTFELETTPLPGRENEFESVLSFIHDRMQQIHRKALFVFGACGCGKTSTILRALRAISDKPLNIDRQIRNKNSSKKWNGETDNKTSLLNSKLHETHINQCCKQSASSNTLKKCVSRKTRRSENEDFSDDELTEKVTRNTTSRKSDVDKRQTFRRKLEDNNNNTVDSARSSTDSLNAAATRSSALLRTATPTATTKKNEEEEEEEETHKKCSPCTSDVTTVHSTTNFLHQCKDRYPALFSITQRRRRLQGYYVNCADMNGTQLIESIMNSIKGAFPRPDTSTRELMHAITNLSSPSSSSASALRSSFNAQTRCNMTATMTMSESVKRRAYAAPFHVLVLDEVENARVQARRTLTALSLLSFQLSSQLTLVFISNQRELVHIPQTLLYELPFAAYSIEHLKQIATVFIDEELHLHAQSNSSKDKNEKRSEAKVQVSVNRSVYDYIARRALLNNSGDVRQVAALCKRMVQAAIENNNTSSNSSNNNNNKNNIADYTSHKYIAILKGDKQDHACECEHKEGDNFSTEDSNGRTSTTSATSSLSSFTSTSSSCTEAATTAATLTADTNTKHTVSLRETKSSIASNTNTTASPTCINNNNNNNNNNTNFSSSSSSSSSPLCITLARSVPALKESAIEDQIHRYIATIPEQTLYILSCLIVLTLRGEEEQHRASMAISGVTTRSSTRLTNLSRNKQALRSSSSSFSTSAPFFSSHTSSSINLHSSNHNIRSSSSYNMNEIINVRNVSKAQQSITLTTREVHQLYTSLMGERHFPSMNATSVQLAIDNLADWGILTRPVHRGNNCAFCFNGTWSLQSMQDAITLRGEALRNEMVACGLDGSENKFVSVLRDLKRLAHLTY